MDQDRFAEHIYIALSARYCHTPLIYNSTAKPLILSKHRFKVSMEYLPNNPTYRIRLSIHAPDVPKYWTIDYLMSTDMVDSMDRPLLLYSVISYFETELKSMFIKPEDTEITRQLYGL